MMGGCILTDNNDIFETIRELRFYQGSILAPYSAWLLRRSLHTLHIRLEHQGSTTLTIKDFLKRQPVIKNVYYPAIDGSQLTNYGTLIFFTFKPEYVDHYLLFAKTLKLFSTGTGMACISSMIAQPYTGSHASMNADEKRSMGLDRSLIRLSFGLESVNDLIEDLRNAFSAILNASGMI